MIKERSSVLSKGASLILPIVLSGIGLAPVSMQSSQTKTAMPGKYWCPNSAGLPHLQHLNLRLNRKVWNLVQERGDLRKFGPTKIALS